MSDQVSAYEVLQRLAKRSLSHAQQLPSQIDTVEQWSGIGFSLLGFHFVIPMDELTEMLEIPAHTRLPGVHPWIKGVSNVRGRLLPLFDLAAFYAGSLSGHKKNQRLLVLDNASIYAGLWVDQVFGRQYFDAETEMTLKDTSLPEGMRECVHSYYESDGTRWLVFSAKALCEDSRFLNVAVN
jgi:twitching motility protein PilI